MNKVLIFIVCYNAERFIEKVLDRIPEEVWQSSKFETEVLIIDDKSPDATFLTAHAYTQQRGMEKVTILCNPVNQGYGGNQKIGYHYAIEKGFDVVLLLHGDGQYPPEFITQMVEPIIDGEADVVFGSRMINKRDALKGRMPLYKWIGNQILTGIQNRLLKSQLAEFHTGYRAYSVKALAEVPFPLNSDYFDFDTDIIIQMLDTGQRIKEIPIPTFYGEEVSRVNGIRYALLILRTTLMSRIMKLGLFYHPKFDYQQDNTRYEGKFGYPSSHQFAVDQLSTGMTVLDIGCGPGVMARELAGRSIETISMDIQIQPEVAEYSIKTVETDIETYDFARCDRPIQAILLLDILEHLRSPEFLLRRLRTAYSAQAPSVIITTGNVGFILVRLGLLAGMFNYARRGILDLDHTRLFTFGSLRRLLETHGYELLMTRGLPAPFPLSLGNTRLARFLLAINCLFIRISRPWFSYQIAMVVRPRPTLTQLLKDAEQMRDTLLSTAGR